LKVKGKEKNDGAEGPPSRSERFAKQYDLEWIPSWGSQRDKSPESDSSKEDWGKKKKKKKGGERYSNMIHNLLGESEGRGGS